MTMTLHYNRLALVLRLSCLLWLCAFLYLLLQGHFSGINSDMWDIFPWYVNVLQGHTPDWQFFFKKYALAHTIVIPKLIFLLDLHWTHGNGGLSPLVSLVAFFCALGVVYQQLRQEMESHLAKIMLLPAMCFTFLDTYQVEALNWDFLLQWYLAFLFVVLAFSACARLARPSLADLPRLLVLLLLASLSGSAAIPGIVIVGMYFWVARSPWQVILVYALFALPALFFLFPDVQVMQSPAFLEYMHIEQLKPVFPWFFIALIRYGAAPFTHYSPIVFSCAGLVILLVQASYVAHGFLTRSTASSFLWMLTAYSLLMGIMIVAGRFQINDALDATMRFALFFGLNLCVTWVLLVRWRLRLGILFLFILLVLQIAHSSRESIGFLETATNLKKTEINMRAGGYGHLSLLKVSARHLSQGVNPALDYRAFLQTHQMDIFYHDTFEVPLLAEDEQSCHLSLFSRFPVNNKQFLEYRSVVVDSQGRPALRLWGIEPAQGKTVFAGRLLKRIVKNGVFNSYSFAEAWKNRYLWQPLSWLSAEQTEMYFIAPRDVDIATLTMRAETADHKQCAVVTQ